MADEEKETVRNRGLAKEFKQVEATDHAPRGNVQSREDDERFIDTPPPHPF